MKKIILLSVLSILTFTACEKNLYDADLAKQKETVKDLVVPENFDWEMTQTVTVDLSATVATPACVYVNEQCTEEYKIIDYTIIPGMMPASVTVPAAIHKLYVKYDNVVEPVAINNQVAKLVLATTKATTRGWGNGNNEVPISVGKNWSTLLFEDLFPKYGDYDFNDLVANYKYNVVYVVSSNNQDNLNSSHIVGYEFELRINAVGAYLPITPYLKVTTKHNDLMKKGNVFNLDPSNAIITTSDPGIKMELVATGNDYQIFKFVGMTDKPTNEFLNTEADKALAAPKTIKVEAHTASNQGTKWSEAYSADVLEFDFFITNGTDEIHKKGFEPALNLRPYPANEIEEGAGEKYYSNGKNMIWALDVPALINHTIEKRNFRAAYPQFEGWATSGGTNNTNWYESPVAAHLINYMGTYTIQ